MSLLYFSMSILYVFNNITLVPKSSKALPFTSRICASLLHFILWGGFEFLVTFMFLLSYCAADLLEILCFFRQGSFPNKMLSLPLQSMDHPTMRLNLRKLTPVAGNFAESWTWAETIPVKKKGHTFSTFPLENISVHFFSGSLRPSPMKSDNNYRMDLSIKMPNTVGNHPLKSGYHQQMMVGTLSHSNCKSYLFRALRLNQIWHTGNNSYYSA